MKTLTLVLILLFAPPALAIEWQALSEGQQGVLREYQDGWHEMPPAERQQLASGAERWLTLSRDERAQIRQRYDRWQAMPPAQRQRLLQRWEAFRGLTVQQRRTLRQTMKRIRALPPARRERLRQRFIKMTPEERGRALDRMRERAKAASEAG